MNAYDAVKMQSAARATFVPFLYMMYNDPNLPYPFCLLRLKSLQKLQNAPTLGRIMKKNKNIVGTGTLKNFLYSEWNVRS